MIEIMKKGQWLKVEPLKSPILNENYLQVKMITLKLRILFFIASFGKRCEKGFFMSDQSCALFWMPNLKTKSWKESNAHVNF